MDTLPNESHIQELNMTESNTYPNYPISWENSQTSNTQQKLDTPIISSQSPVRYTILGSYESNLDDLYSNDSIIPLCGNNSVTRTSEQTNNSLNQQMTENCRTSDSQREELVNLLKEWNLQNLLENLIAEDVNVEVLKVIKRHHIGTLLKDCHLGKRVLFEHHLEKWRESIGLSLESHCSLCHSNDPHNIEKIASPLTVSPRSSPYPSRTPTPEPLKTQMIKLSNILNDTSKGLLLSELYEKNSKFTDDQRSVLINCVAQYFDDISTHLTLSASYRLEDEIIIRFPTEKLEFYRTGKRGRIYNKYCNLKTSIKNFSKIIEKLPSTEKGPSTSIEPEVDAESCIRSLKYDNLTAQEFDHCWRACSQYRLNEIQKLQSSAAIFEKWPEYKRPSGYRLVEMDFQILHNNNRSMLDNWSEDYKKLLDFLSSEGSIKEKNIKAVIKTLKEGTNLTENGQFAALLWALHGYLVPTQKVVRKDNTGKKSTTKYTIKDSQESFLFVGKCSQELEDHLRFIQQKSENIQPFILAIGEDVLNIKELFLYFDGVKFPFQNFIRAVDICLKIFFLFNLEFPIASLSFWSFIQDYFFSINPSNKKFPKVSILIQELQDKK